MNSEKTYSSLKTWQVIELVLLFLFIPVSYGEAILYTGYGDRGYYLTNYTGIRNYFVFIASFTIDSFSL